MEKLNNLVKLVLVVLITIVVSATIGANGCAWVGQTGDPANSASGSSGAIAGSPNPTNGATNVPITVQLSWASVGGALSYDVYLGISPTVSYLTNVPNTAIRTRWTPTVTVNYGTTYLWRIDTKDAGHNTYYGTVWSFTTVVQTFTLTNPNPANGATNVPITSTLSWSAVLPEGRSYDVYFGTTGVPPCVVTGSATTTYSPTLSYNVRYYWHIKAKNSHGQVIATGNLWNFITQTTLTPATAPNPANNTTNALPGMTLSWVPSAAATIYDVYFGTSAVTWTVVARVPKVIPRTTYTPTPGLIAYGTQYYWKVDGNPPAGAGVGPTWTFTTLTLPGLVNSPVPTNTATSVPITSTLGWASAANATSYNVYFGTTPAPTFRLNTTNTLYNPGTLLYNATYYWRINSRNNTGVMTGNLWSFTTAIQLPPGPATSPQPLSGTVNCPINTVLTWASGADADSYDVYFGTTSTPPLTYTHIVKTVYRSRFTPTASLAYSTTYYWQIIARNNGGAAPSGVVWNFSTIAAIPLRAGNANPSSGTLGEPINPVLSWVDPGNASPNRATSYDIYFGATSTLNASNFKGNTVLTSFSPSVLSYSTLYYWRIDARNAVGITTGLVWSFQTLTPPAQAMVITPTGSDILASTALMWHDASRATSYNVFLDTAMPPVNLVTSTAITNWPVALAWGTTYYWRVDAVNDAGVMAGVNQTFTTVIPPDPVPAVPINPTPSGIIDVNKNVTLQWGTAARAWFYDVYLGTFPKVIITAPSTSYTPPGGLTPGATYSWRVDARNPAATITGTTWTFTVLPLPGQVTLSSPTDGFIDQVITTTLTWTPATKVDSYNIYLGTNPNPSMWLGGNVLSPTTTFTVTLTPGIKYYWKIGSVNTSGEVASAIRNFTTLPLPAQVTGPGPGSPSSGWLVTQTLSWSSANNADSYDVYFGAVNPPPFIRNQTGLSYNPTLGYSAQYYWRIDSVNTSGVTQGDVWQFATLFPPSKASVITPTGTGILNDVDLTWNTVLSATSYDVYFGTGNPPAWVVTGTFGTTYDTGTMDWNTPYYWRINPKNQAGTTIGDLWTFTTLERPDSSGQPSPADGATGQLNDVQLGWTSAARATSYDVYFNVSPTLTSRGNQGGITYTPGTLLWNTVYNWRIDARNAAGATTGAVWTFTTLKWPDLVTSPVPTDTATNVITTTGLAWTAAARATSYDVYFDASPTLTSRGNQNGITYTPSTLLWNTVYTWRIDAKNLAGTTTGTVWQFTTQVQPPDKVTGPTPSDTATGVPTSQTLSWNSATRASSYDVYFDVSPTLTSKGNQGGLTYNPGALTGNTTYSWRIDSRNSGGITQGDVWSFTTVANTTPQWSRIAGGWYHTLAVKSDGTLWAWGRNQYGQVSNGAIGGEIDIPTKVGASTDWSDVANVGGNHSVALKKDGSIWTWGYNGYGQLGNGNTGTNTNTPGSIAGTDSGYIAVAAGQNFSMGLKSNGTLWTWGAIGGGNYNTPQQVPGTTWTAIGAGAFHAMALQSGNTLWTWGDNSYGQLGIGVSGGTYNTPQQVPGTSWAPHFAGGRWYSIALQTDGSVWTWGDNIYGQLGNNTYGSPTNTNSPGPIAGTNSGYTSVASAWYTSVALKSDNSLWTWGRCKYGEIGDGTSDAVSGADVGDKKVPTKIGGNNWSIICAGYWTTHACKTDGTLWGWGSNSWGQVGNDPSGNDYDSTIPTAVYVP